VRLADLLDVVPATLTRLRQLIDELASIPLEERRVGAVRRFGELLILLQVVAFEALDPLEVSGGDVLD
jgi:hypothetical protein